MYSILLQGLITRNGIPIQELGRLNSQKIGILAAKRSTNGIMAPVGRNFTAHSRCFINTATILPTAVGMVAIIAFCVFLVAVGFRTDRCCASTSLQLAWATPRLLGASTLYLHHNLRITPVTPKFVET